MDDDSSVADGSRAGNDVNADCVSLPGSDAVLSPTIGDLLKHESWPNMQGDGAQTTADAGPLPEGLVASLDPNKAKKKSRKNPPLGNILI